MCRKLTKDISQWDKIQLKYVLAKVKVKVDKKNHIGRLALWLMSLIEIELFW